MTETATARLNDYRILLAGKATLTLSHGDTRYTYRVKRVESEHEGRDATFFVSFLSGSNNDTDYRYLGILSPRDGRLIHTRGSKAGADSKAFKGFAWLAAKMFAGLQADELPNGVECRWSNCCQRCGRTLTVPSSIDSRLGPDCAGRV